MATQIFINLAVNDLQRSMKFYEGMGFTNNPQFSDDTAKGMVWDEHIHVMLLTKEKFKTFTDKPLAETKSHLAGLYAISIENLDRVHQIADRAVEAGGTEPTPFKDYGFMQVRTVEDPDGHTWEIFVMDMSKMPTE